MATGGTDPSEVVVVTEGDQDGEVEHADPTLRDRMKKVQVYWYSLDPFHQTKCAHFPFCLTLTLTLEENYVSISSYMYLYMCKVGLSNQFCLWVEGHTMYRVKRLLNAVITLESDASV